MNLNLNALRIITVALLGSSLVTGCNKSNVKNSNSFTESLLTEKISEIHYGVQGIVNDPREITVDTVYNSSLYNRKVFPNVLNRTVDIKWYGDAKTVLRSLEAQFGDEFQVRVQGKPVSHPIDVYLNSEKEVLFNVLKDIGHQLGDDVVLNVIIDPFEKFKVEVELTYNNEM